MPRPDRILWRSIPLPSLAATALFFVALLVGCAAPETTGTYDVEIEIAGNHSPIRGTLVLSALPLDVPSNAYETETIDPGWYGGDEDGANSCFILEPSPGTEDDPGYVRVFETRLSSGQVVTPLLILSPDDLRIRIVSIQFFGRALGGDLEVDAPGGQRLGRIHGERRGPPDTLLCVETLETFRKALRTLPPS